MWRWASKLDFCLHSPAILAGWSRDPHINRSRMGRLCELAVNRRTDYSDDWPAPVQRRYTMPQRSPVIFWLLLAATVAIDAVVFAWMVLEPYPKFAAVA